MKNLQKGSTKIVIILLIIVAIIGSWLIYKYLNPPLSPFDFKLQALREDKDTQMIYVSGEYIQKVSRIPGAGSTYYFPDGSTISCPLANPSAGNTNKACEQFEDMDWALHYEYLPLYD